MSERGGVRPTNEDACIVQPNLLAVADGMGGYAGGEVAARLALSAVCELEGQVVLGPQVVRQVFEQAHRRIQETSAREPRWSEMGTTLTVVWVENGRAFLGHVGDSRAYLLRDGSLRQLTDDHSVAAELVRNGTLTEQEARRHPHRHVLTRALGGAGTPDVDVAEIVLARDDRLVLCTDGLTTLLEPNELAECVMSARTPEEAAKNLVARASLADAPDNVTVAVGFVGEEDLEQEALPGAESS